MNTPARIKLRLSGAFQGFTGERQATNGGPSIDLKLCTPGREKDLIAEINDDILAYKSKDGNLFFFVYELGSIRDTYIFIRSFQEHEGVGGPSFLRPKIRLERA